MSSNNANFFWAPMLFFSLIIMLILNSCGSQESQNFELLLKNAQLIDGSGASMYEASVGINADTIAWIGDYHPGLSGTEEMDLSTYYLTPGFIDPHTHTLLDLQSKNKDRRSNQNYLVQGVTTVINGNDGGGPAKVGMVLDELDSIGIGTNAALLVGHRSIRRLVMGMKERVPTEEELQQMKTIVKIAMEDGSLGFSSGLFYVPASFAKTEEVIELAKVAAEYGGLYDVHLRDESTYNIGLLGAVEETIEIGRKARIKANIAHIKALGVDVWGLSQQVIDKVNQARAEGVLLTADQYPFEASSTALSAALVPKWVFADIDNYLVRFDDPELGPQIREEMAENLRRRGGPAAVLLIGATDPTFDGQSLEKLSDINQKDPVEMAIEVLKKGGSRIASFNMREDDIKNFMAQDWVMTSSDGTASHPRKYSSFSRKMEKYVMGEGVLSLEEMIRRSTGMTAEVFGIPKRGVIKVGNYADVIAFKAEEVKSNATYEDPAQLSEGMHLVVVNGKPVVRESKYNGEMAGRAIYKR